MDYLTVTAANADLRKSLVPLRLFATTDTGGSLNVMSHFYDYASLEEREALRGTQAGNKDWQAYLSQSRPCCLLQKSTIWHEALFVGDIAEETGFTVESLGSSGADAKGTLYEIVRYKLKVGYDVASDFMSAHEKSIRLKQEAIAGTTTSQFCSVLLSEFGAKNEVIELWRHSSMEGLLRMHEASRTNQTWKESIQRIAPITMEVTSTLTRPTAFSNWK